MKNTVTLVGFAGSAPELRNLTNGAKATNLSLATSRSWKDGEGKRQTETEWHRITCFNGIGKLKPPEQQKSVRFEPEDKLLAFLDAL